MRGFELQNKYIMQINLSLNLKYTLNIAIAIIKCSCLYKP